MSSRPDRQISHLLQRLDDLVSELRDACSRLEEETLRDELTGLYNRRALDQRLEEEIHRATRHGQALSLLFIDIDDFKAYNDRLGHGMGDKALAATAKALAGCGRAMDLFFRYGGEEFVALLPQTEGKAAIKVAERIRRTVAERAVCDSGIRLTLSIGVASFPEHGSDGPSLLAAADRAQYHAKGRGKNRVYVISDCGNDAVPAEPEAAADEATVADAVRPIRSEPSAPSTRLGNGERQVAVGFRAGGKRPVSIWIGEQMYPIHKVETTTARVPGVRRHYTIHVGAGTYVLMWRGVGWYVRPL